MFAANKRTLKHMKQKLTKKKKRNTQTYKEDFSTPLPVIYRISRHKIREEIEE